MNNELLLIETLKNNGLSDAEARVYLTSLALGEKSASAISKKAGLKRPTTYLVIERLLNKGFLMSRTASRGLVFRAANPKFLIEQQRQACLSLEGILPALIQLSCRGAEAPDISLNYGKEHIAAYWEQCLSSQTDVVYWADSRLTYGAEQVMQGVDTDEATGFPSESNTVEYVKRRVKKGVWVKGLIPYQSNKNLLSHQGLLRLQNHYLQLKKSGPSQLREFVFVPKDEFDLIHEISSFNDKVCVVSYVDGMVLTITSSSIARCIQAIFRMSFAYAKSRESSILSEEDLLYLSRSAL